MDQQESDCTFSSPAESRLQGSALVTWGFPSAQGLRGVLLKALWRGREGRAA